MTGKPEEIEGIEVGRKAAELHFLQGAGYDTDDGRHVVDWWAYPDKEIAVIDFVAADITPARAPSCAAIAVEEAKADEKKGDKSRGGRRTNSPRHQCP